MALQINYTDNSGVNHSECYCKIDKINTSYKENSITVIMIMVKFYHTKNTRDTNLNPFLIIPYVNKNFNEEALGTGSLRGLLYTYLKTLTLFSTATDV